MNRQIAAFLLLLACAEAGKAQTGAAVAEIAPLAPTPPMGWSTWYGVRCDYDEKLLREVADRMASGGLAEAGYRYLNVDDCWAVSRDPSGRLVADPKRFPSGMRALADYIHSKGLKFGIYTSAGTTTCQRDLQADASRLPIGSRGHEVLDMKQFADWGADLVKVDWCGRYPTQDGPSSFQTFRDAIAASGRPMLLSICEWGWSKPWTWGRGVGQMWRVAMDTLNCWACTTDWGGIGVAMTFDRLAEVSAAGGPDGWNDPDNVMAANGVLTPDQARAQLSVYAVAATPLILAADPRKLSAAELALITNRDMIRINQDPLGKPGRRVRADGEQDLWVRALTDGRLAVALVNRTTRQSKLTLDTTELGWPVGVAMRGREAWSGRDVSGKGRVTLDVAPHGAALLILEPAVAEGVRPPV
jgi:alpha-galactosidase